MNRKDETTLALADWIAAVRDGEDTTTAADIKRLRKRPQGPHRHRYEVRQWPVPDEALRKEDVSLADFRALLDGTICWLFRVPDSQTGTPILRARIGERVWNFDGQPCKCRGGRILGVNENGEPIVKMCVPTDAHIDQDAAASIVFIGGRDPGANEFFLESRQARHGWTVGEDGRLYCLKRCMGARGCSWRLMGYDPLTMEQLHESGEFWGGFGARIESLAVRNPDQFLVVSDDGVRDERMPDKRWPWYSMVVRGHVFRGSRLHGTKAVLAGGYTYELHDRGPAHEPSDRVCSWTRLPLADDERFDPRFRGGGTAEYVRGLTVLDEGSGRCAYIGHVNGGLGWVLPEEDGEQPAFKAVSDLFQQGGEWRYWGFAEGWLWLMRLP